MKLGEKQHVLSKMAGKSLPSVIKSMKNIVLEGDYDIFCRKWSVNGSHHFDRKKHSFFGDLGALKAPSE